MITESEIFTAIVATLNAGLATRGVKDVAAKQWYQPRVIGAPPGMSMLLSTVSVPRYGFLARADAWDQASQTEKHTELQTYRFTFQCTGLARPSPPPAPLPPMRGGDLAKLAATILASDAGRRQLRAAGFGMERIAEVREPYIKDESDQFEQSASFDCTLTYNDMETTAAPTVNKTELDIFRV